MYHLLQTELNLKSKQLINISGDSLLIHCGQMIPKLKSRTDKSAKPQEQSGGAAGGQGAAKKKGKKKWIEILKWLKFLFRQFSTGDLFYTEIYFTNCLCYTGLKHHTELQSINLITCVKTLISCYLLFFLSHVFVELSALFDWCKL